MRNSAHWNPSASREQKRNGGLSRGDLLDPLSGQSDEAIAQHHHVSRGTVVLCIRKCLQSGLETALEELPRSGKPRQLPDDAKAWAQSCACRKPKELGYSYERLRPHKIRYYVERRDPGFEAKMESMLHVYKEVEIINDGLLRGEVREPGMVTISYDERPGTQAVAVTTPDRPPDAGQHSSHLRDYEYKRLGTVSLLAGLDLHSGRVIETISNTHKALISSPF